MTPYAWSMAGGALPNGMALSSGGARAARRPVRRLHLHRRRVRQRLAGQHGPGHVLVLVSRLGRRNHGDAPRRAGRVTYPGATLSASDGSAPYTWAVTQGSLPDGLSLAPDGTISGTPAADAVTESFTVTATDSEHANGPDGLRAVDHDRAGGGAGDDHVAARRPGVGPPTRQPS